MHLTNQSLRMSQKVEDYQKWDESNERPKTQQMNYKPNVTLRKNQENSKSVYLKPFKGIYGDMTKSSNNLSKTSATNYNSVTKIKAKRSSVESTNSQISPTRENIYSTFENYE